MQSNNIIFPASDLRQLYNNFGQVQIPANLTKMSAMPNQFDMNLTERPKVSPYDLLAKAPSRSSSTPPQGSPDVNRFGLTGPLIASAPVIPSGRMSVNDIMSKKIGEDTFNPVYEIKEEQRRITVHTTSSEYYNKINRGELPCGGVCSWCLNPFSGPVYSYPIAHKIIREKRLNENGEIAYYNTHEFLPEGTPFCDFSCALAYLDFMCSGRSNEATPVEESRVYLLQEFELLYPGQDLVPARNRKLLNTCGGHMPYEEWKRGNFILKPMHNIIYSPVKTSYAIYQEPKLEVVEPAKPVNNYSNLLSSLPTLRKN